VNFVTKQTTLEQRRKFLGRNLSVAYRNPVKIVRGEMQYLYDDEGRRYLDAYNNVAHVGHCHPRVVAAGVEQMRLLNTNTRYLHDLILSYAERLTATLPDLLSVCYFVNSGSEANELALRLAQAHTKAQDLIVLDHAYHGNTTTLIDISPYKHDGPGGSGRASWVHKAELNDPLSVVEAVKRVTEGGRDLCGFIAESMPSVAGQIVLPTDYLKQAYAAVRQAGGVCIADEVQTGYGRIGTHFWAFEYYDVVPDIVVLGKPIGNGHPIGAVITTREIADSFNNGMEFFSTFGGNTVSCAIGLEVLSVVQEENLQQHALAVGNHLLDGLRDLQQRYEIIRDVRGSGFFIGVELATKGEPATTAPETIVNRMRDEGVLLGTDGPHHNVLKIRPPMPFSETDADLLLAVLSSAIEQEGK
jgi:4-aminobutyrate aminotransferase-like enzyme